MMDDEVLILANTDIQKLKEIFPFISVAIIQNIFEENSCILEDTIEELLNTTTAELKQKFLKGLPGSSGSSGAKAQNKDDDVVRISDEDEDDHNFGKKESEFSLKISFDKFSYLQAIFPNVQTQYLKKNLDRIGDDDTKFQIFLNECLADPKRLPRQTWAVPSVKRGRQNDGPKMVSFSSIYMRSRSEIKGELFELGMSVLGTKFELAQVRNRLHVWEFL